MTETLTSRVLRLAELELSPIEIALSLDCGRDSNSVRTILSKARKQGLDYPRFGTAPLSPKLPASNKRVLGGDSAVAANRQIAELLAEGVPQRKVAAQLGLSLGYVQRHRQAA